MTEFLLELNPRVFTVIPIKDCGETQDLYRVFVDATIRTKYQIRTRDRFGPKTNSAQNLNYL